MSEPNEPGEPITVSLDLTPASSAAIRATTKNLGRAYGLYEDPRLTQEEQKAKSEGAPIALDLFTLDISGTTDVDELLAAIQTFVQGSPPPDLNGAGDAFVRVSAPAHEAVDLMAPQPSFDLVITSPSLLDYRRRLLDHLVDDGFGVETVAAGGAVSNPWMPSWQGRIPLLRAPSRDTALAIAGSVGAAREQEPLAVWRVSVDMPTRRRLLTLHHFPTAAEEQLAALPCVLAQQFEDIAVTAEFARADVAALRQLLRVINGLHPTAGALRLTDALDRVDLLNGDPEIAVWDHLQSVALQPVEHVMGMLQQGRCQDEIQQYIGGYATDLHSLLSDEAASLGEALVDLNMELAAGHHRDRYAAIARDASAEMRSRYMPLAARGRPAREEKPQSIVREAMNALSELDKTLATMTDAHRQIASGVRLTTADPLTALQIGVASARHQMGMPVDEHVERRNLSRHALHLPDQHTVHDMTAARVAGVSALSAYDLVTDALLRAAHMSPAVRRELGYAANGRSTIGAIARQIGERLQRPAQAHPAQTVSAGSAPRQFEESLARALRDPRQNTLMTHLGAAVAGVIEAGLREGRNVEHVVTLLTTVDGLAAVVTPHLSTRVETNRTTRNAPDQRRSPSPLVALRVRAKTERDRDHHLAETVDRGVSELAAKHAAEVAALRNVPTPVQTPAGSTSSQQVLLNNRMHSANRLDATQPGGPPPRTRRPMLSATQGSLRLRSARGRSGKPPPPPSPRPAPLTTPPRSSGTERAAEVAATLTSLAAAQHGRTTPMTRSPRESTTANGRPAAAPGRPAPVLFRGRQSPEQTERPAPTGRPPQTARPAPGRPAAGYGTASGNAAGMG